MSDEIAADNQIVNKEYDVDGNIENADATTNVNQIDNSLNFISRKSSENSIVSNEQITDKTNVEQDLKDKLNETTNELIMTNISMEDTHPLSDEELLSELKKREELYTITKMNYLWLLLSGLLYVVDVLSDLVLGIRYLVTAQWAFGGLTLFFVIGSSVLYNLFNRSATWRKSKRNRWFWLWIWPYFLLNLQPLIQMKVNWGLVRRHHRLSKSQSSVLKRVELHREFMVGYKRAAALKHDESLWEATPQLILQLYALSSAWAELQWSQTLQLQLLALASSAAGMVATSYTYHRAFHFPLGERVSHTGAALMAIGYAGGLTLRACSLGANFTASPWYLSLTLLAAHWSLTLLWWKKYGWEHTTGLASLAEATGLMLQPSLRTPLQCLCTSAVLLIEDLFFLLGWALLSFSKLWPIMLTLFIVEAVCRYIMVTYWYLKERFILLLLPACTSTMQQNTVNTPPVVNNTLT